MPENKEVFGSIIPQKETLIKEIAPARSIGIGIWPDWKMIYCVEKKKRGTTRCCL